MGNGQSIITSCGSPRDGLAKEPLCHAPAIPTAEELSAYVNDVKAAVKSQIESPAARYHRYLLSLTPNDEALKRTTAAFVDECGIALSCHKRHPNEYIPSECSFKHLDAYVPTSPKGNESGVYYALDFGGSNFRVLRVAMNNGDVKSTAKKASLTECETELAKGLLDPKATATLMFDYFAKICEEFMNENGDIKTNRRFPVGFTFSFPCAMRSLGSAYAMVWTKGFETGRDTDDPVEGTDVAELMNMAFQRRNLPLRVNCVANDTVGTLLSCAYTLDRSAHPPCAIGLILGTGMNACYVDDRALEWGYKGKIINIECGNFNRDLPRTNIDYELDFADVGGRGRQHLEKMVSGGYIGEICRRTLVKIFQADAPELMWQPNTFSSEDASICIGDKSEALVVVARKCQERWQASFALQELTWIRTICDAVFKRAAALSAMIIAGCALKSGRLQEAMGGLSVGIDGSLWKCNSFFRQDIRNYLKVILGEKQAALVHLLDSDDGSGLGAAILSAVAETL